MFMTFVAWSGRFGLDIVGSLIGNTDASSLVSRGIEIVSVLLIVLAIYVLVRIDWTKLISGRMNAEEQSKIETS
jgi:hypothetical protein